jgi:hypothetical protein
VRYHPLAGGGSEVGNLGGEGVCVHSSGAADYVECLAQGGYSGVAVSAFEVAPAEACDGPAHLEGHVHFPSQYERMLMAVSRVRVVALDAVQGADLVKRLCLTAAVADLAEDRERLLQACLGFGKAFLVPRDFGEPGESVSLINALSISSARASASARRRRAAAKSPVRQYRLP